ncbi:AfsR/SARP family transcriptional regulator [Amycolatopsis vancoresmycina]|uniref:AfsR/SARP family transcriptional regulator n=1 Tax=Amycolatopsis vancoresmycina TaxID=208444 RepID=UPI001FD0093B|nr:BTAD domain-containing putative transcriptional regulator [Amycolatopsis vancoresmycina]
MDFRILGSLAICDDGENLAVGPPRIRVLLALLLADPGQLVSVGRIIDEMWPESPPSGADALVHSYVSRLRRVLRSGPTGPAAARRLITRKPGYLLEVAEHELDSYRYHRLVADARAARNGGSPRDRVALLGQADQLWHGPPFGDVPPTPMVAAAAIKLTEFRLNVLEERFETALDAGHDENLVVELTELATRHPLRERLVGQLILALYRNGRQADALDRYQQLRMRLAEELGTNPSPPLQHLHHRILTADPALTSLPAAARTPIPRQLPAAPRLFTGRKDELAQLTTTVDTAGNQGDVVVISALGGIGKTWLAVRWAHENLHRFPDGQLFADLHGFSPTERPAHPTDVLDGFLHALGVDRDRQPDDPDHRAELYRSLLAGKRLLIVLDNAFTTNQVACLLPGGGHCTVIVTSRNQLRGLAARHGAHPLHLDVLTDSEAHTLLTTSIGPDRANTDPQAITELIGLCGGFPLALGVIAARATADAQLPLADIVGELRTRGLDALDSDDLTASLPATLSWSLSHLTDRQRQAFALLGIAPGPDTGLPAAAALTGLSERETYRVLQALADASLINRTAGGRYVMHDLLRAYAAELADHAGHRSAALTRLFEYYLRTTTDAMTCYAPYQPTRQRAGPQLTPYRPVFTAPGSALAWLDTERANLVTSAVYAADHGWPTYTSQLSVTLFRYLDNGAHRTDAQQLHTAALHTADVDDTTPAAGKYGTVLWRAGRYQDTLTHYQHMLDNLGNTDDRHALAVIHGNLGIVHQRLGHDQPALDHCHRAIDIYSEIGDRFGEGSARGNLGILYEQLGRNHDALDQYQQSVTLLHQTGSRSFHALAYGKLGLACAKVGRHQDARLHHQQALAILGEIPNRQYDAVTLNDVGATLCLLGQPTQAIRYHHHALTHATDVGDHYEQARAHAGLAQAHHTERNTSTARTHWRRALALYTRLGTPEAHHITTVLAEVGVKLDRPKRTSPVDT